MAVVNGNSDAKSLTIALGDLKTVQPEATLVTSSGRYAAVTNSITHPDLIVPREQQMQVAGSQFEHAFEPYSVNVIELSY